MSETLTAIQDALKLVGAGKVEETASAVPTAKARTALDMLAGSSAEELIGSYDFNIRELTENLFNWTGKPKATKALMRALGDALQTPGKYTHAVELTAFLVALVPLMEPDRLARLYDAMKEVNTSFAPARYTLQLSHKLKWLLSDFPEERREKLAYSLWVESHQGRWWDLTAGQAQGNVAQDNNENVMPLNEMLNLYSEFKLPWTPATAQRFAALSENEIVRDTLERYNEGLLKDKIIDPDVAVLASYIPWLTPAERPESPIGGLLDTLKGIRDEVEYKWPEKPKSFSALFPDIRLYGGTQFPFPNSVLTTDGRELIPDIRLELVRNATQLAENRTFMGNCTWSYKSQMEAGTYVLYRVHRGGEIYNAAMTLQRDRWVLREINSRFNRGNVPGNVRDAFMRFMNQLPPVVADNEMTKQREAYKKVQSFKNRKYRHHL